MKFFIVTFFLLILSGSTISMAQQIPHSHRWEPKNIFGEQAEKRRHIFNELNVTINPYAGQSLSADKVNTLNGIIPDFQVNENSGGAGQYAASISIDGSGNFVITWEDNRNDKYGDIYAQRYSSDGSALGNNFKVNDDQGNADQWYPSISTDGSGNFVIAWMDNRNGGGWDIYAQRYTSDGSALGTNFEVNDDLGSADQRNPSISTDDSGNFVITWQDWRNGYFDIYAQCYKSDGSARGTNFQVNDNLEPAYHGYPSISTASSGNFVITWQDERNDFFNRDIYAQRYTSDGSAIGTNFQVNDDSGSAGQWSHPSISTDGSGNFGITWDDMRNGDPDIYVQLYTSDGSAKGTNFKVNDELGSAGQWPHPSISTDSSGNFLISWEDVRNGDSDIYTQRYSSDGSALGTNFKVNDDQGSSDQGNPSNSIDGSGNFVITWMDLRNGDWDIYTQRYTSAGGALGTNFKVNDDSGSAGQESPSISTDSSGNFVVTWQDYRNDIYRDIYAQRYTSDGSALGTNFQVNDDVGNAYQRYPSISTEGSGNFVVTWGDMRNGDYDIYAQRYSREGNFIGTNFRVNDDSGSAWQEEPSISTDGIGNFVITWQDERNGNYDVYAQRYTSDGNALGANFRVNDAQGSVWNWPPEPSVSTDSIGNFVITWGDDRDGDFDIYAQRYTSDGNLIGTNFQVNDDLGTTWQENPSISTDGSGNFVITWMDERNGGWDIYAQRYTSDGSALGTNFQVNDDLGSTLHFSPSISLDRSGNFVMTWWIRAEDIYAQRYSSDGSALGSNFRVTNSSEKIQRTPDVKLWNGRIYSTWKDNRVGGTGYDIWANILDWENPVGKIDKEVSQVPSVFILRQNYPNPFNPVTTIEFDLPTTSEVALKIYNILGEEVATLVSDRLTSGSYSYQWLPPGGVASGVYFYRLESADFVQTRKMVLMK